MKTLWKILISAGMALNLAACAGSASASASASPSASAAPAMDENTALAAYKTASVELEKFYQMKYTIDGKDSITPAGGGTFYLVKDYGTLSELKDHLMQYVTADCADSILSQWSSVYMENDGKLYMLGADTPIDETKGEESDAAAKVSDTEYKITATVQIINPEDNNKVTGSKDFEFPYVLQDGEWRFQEFPKIR